MNSNPNQAFKFELRFKICYWKEGTFTVNAPTYTDAVLIAREICHNGRAYENFDTESVRVSQDIDMTPDMNSGSPTEVLFAKDFDGPIWCNDKTDDLYNA